MVWCSEELYVNDIVYRYLSNLHRSKLENIIKQGCVFWSHYTGGIVRFTVHRINSMNVPCATSQSCQMSISCAVGRLISFPTRPENEVPRHMISRYMNDHTFTPAYYRSPIFSFHPLLTQCDGGPIVSRDRAHGWWHNCRRTCPYLSSFCDVI